MNWRKIEAHPDLFENGETMLVAVPVVQTELGIATTSAGNSEKWGLSVIEIDCDEERFRITCEGEYWGWEWSDVEYWMPIAEVQEGLPKPTLNRG